MYNEEEVKSSRTKQRVEKEDINGQQHVWSWIFLSADEEEEEDE